MTRKYVHTKNRRELELNFQIEKIIKHRLFAWINHYRSQ